MKKLDKSLLASREEIVERLRVEFGDIEGTVDYFNQTMAEAWSAVQSAIEAYNTRLDEEWGNGLGPMIESYNGTIADANGWRQDVVNSISEYIENKSEKWQESENGQRYAAWRDEFDHEFSSFDQDRPEELSLDEPDEITLEWLDDVAELLEQLPEELES